MNTSSSQSLFALSLMIFLISDVQGGIGPFLSIYLSSSLGWDTSQVGIAIATIGLGGLFFQMPSGLVVDIVRPKRLIIAISCFLIFLGCYLIVNQKNLSIVILAQILISIAFSLIPPSIAAITLGIVGRKKFPKRVSINESLIHLGTVFTILTISVVAHIYGHAWIIYATMLFAGLALIPLYFINPGKINYSAARELPSDAHPISFIRLFRSKNLWIFFSAVIIFHFSNAAQVILVGQELAKISPDKDTFYMGLCIILGQLVMVFVAYSLGFFINQINRKPIFLFAFIFLIIRSALFIFIKNPIYLVLIQLIDGISAGIFGVVATIMVSDLAANTGRFNFLLGTLGMCVGLGSSMSNLLGGFLAKSYGFSIGFFSLCLIAFLGFNIYLFLLKETKNLD
ncbi:MFS transporter [Legionella sp.]|uniref:MFS transporter n=1 Tax=Legionella sp. TaxID=459 RepID=UPI000CC4A14F|nr:MFS transporter [Legionella sp.]PJE15609.1 MAG: MFS transporter [Legionella sp.]